MDDFVSQAFFIRRLRHDLPHSTQEAAAWLVDAGYPFDFQTENRPPLQLRKAIAARVLEDPDGSLHGNDLDYSGVLDLIAAEAGADWVEGL